MKSTATKLIDTLRSTNNPGAVEIDHRTIITAILGYSDKQLTGKHPPKRLTFNLTTMASVEDVRKLTDIMVKAGYPAEDDLSPALIGMNASPEMMKGYTADTLSGMITALLTTPAEAVTVDKIWEIYAVAAYLRKKKITKIVVVVTATVIAAIAAAGLIMFFRSREEDHDDDDDDDPDDDIVVEDGEIVVISDDEMSLPSDDELPSMPEA